MNDYDDSIPSKPACTEPDLGEALSRRLDTGQPLPPVLEAHLRICLACQVEQLEFDRLEPVGTEVPAEMVSSLRRALDELRG